MQDHLQDKLAEHERKSVLRVLKYANEKPAAGIVVSLAVGAVLAVAAGPAAAGVIAGELLTPHRMADATCPIRPMRETISCRACSTVPAMLPTGATASNCRIR